MDIHAFVHVLLDIEGDNRVLSNVSFLMMYECGKRKP